MAPERSKSAKPGGLRLPGTFNSSPTASPAPRRPASSNSTPSASSLKPARTVSSVPASRLTATKPILPGTSGGLLSSFGSGERGGANNGRREPTRLERLERARSTPNVAKDDGVSRLRSLGLNRALPKRRSPSPEEESPEEGSEEEDYRKRSKTPEPSWGRRSSGEEETRPRESTRKKGSFSPTRSSSPSTASRRSSPPVVIPPVNEDHDATEEGKGTIFGSLWNRASQAWSGGAAEPHVVKEGEGNRRDSLTEHLEPPESKVTPFRITKSGQHEDEAEPVPPHSPQKEPSNFLNTRPIPLSQHRRSQSLSEPVHAPVEPITYHRPPDIHPRNILLNSASRGRRYRDQYDWLESLDESPLDPFLFHRSATRMATKKVRLKRPPPVGMATAPAILAGTAYAARGGMARNGHLPQQVGNSVQPHSAPGLSPGVFVPQPSSGPVQAFSHSPHQPSAYASTTPHPGPPPVPPPIPPGYQPHPSSSSGAAVAATAGFAGTIATSQPLSSAPPPSNPNPNALPSFPAPPSQPPPQAVSQSGSAQPVQSRPPIPPMPIVPPLPPAFSSAPIQLPYSYIPTAAPLGYPAPVFTAPAFGPPSMITPAAPLGDEFKSALAKKLFGSRIPNAPAATLPAGVQASVSNSQAQPHSQSQANPRLPTPSAPAASNPEVTSQGTPSSMEPSHSPIDHGLLPPMPIPQSITPKPPSSSPSAFYAPHLAMSLPPISYAPRRPMTGLGGWILPPSVSPLLTPGPISSSPVPSEGGGVDTPALSTTPVPSVKGETEAGSETGGEEEEPVDETEDPNLPGYDSSTPRPSSTAQSARSLSPTATIADQNSGNLSSFLSLPSLAALATPLPPSPAPGSFLSSSTPILPNREPSPVPSLPEIPASIDSDEFLPSYSVSKALPPSPSPSPSLPPLPVSSDFSSIFSATSPIDSPALPPLPSPSPILSALPLIHEFPSTTITLPSSPPPPSAFSLERGPSLAISTNSMSPSVPSENLEVAQILLQPPTPIEPISASPSPVSITEPFEVDVSTPALSLEPLSLDLDLGFDFDFATPSLVPDSLQDTRSYFSSFGLDFSGVGNEGNEKVERDDEGRLELPVLREENLIDEEEEDESVDEDGDDMSDQFDAATSFVSGFRETDLARAKVDPGHTGRTERWLVGQGVRREEGVEGLTKPIEEVSKGEASKRGEVNSTIDRPRTAPPSSIPPSSFPPSHATLVSRPPLPTIPTSYLSLRSTNLTTLNEDDDNTAASPVQTMINFDRPLSAVNRGREISSSFGSKGGNLASEKEKQEAEKRQAALLGALSNQAFTGL